MQQDAIKSSSAQSEQQPEAVLDDTSCITLIQEYLLFKELKKTSNELRDECKDLRLSCPPNDESMATSMTAEDAQNIMATLNAEDFPTFFKAWHSKVPAGARAADPEARRLLFLCHVAAAARHKDEGMDTLRQYFLELGQQPFTRDAELLHYFALPYVADPHLHPAFQHLYKDDWWAELKSMTGSFVRRYTRGDSGPRLPLLRLGHCVESPGLQHHQLRRRCRQLQTDYHRLLGVAGELTAALENAVRGETLDLGVTLRNCTTIFPELFPCTNNRASPESVLRRSLQQRSSVLSLQSAAELELDFRKVRSHLASPQNTKTRLLLMQALRWRISRSSPEERDLAVASMVRHDVLGLRGGFCLLTLLNAPDGDTPHPLQQGTARLVNALASLRTGRDYLSTPPGEQVVGVAAACLTGARPGVKIDDGTSDMLLAMLQKLSLRRIHRETMISAGLVEWLVPRLEVALETLKKKPDSSTYALEYATALLMNLCLHSRAKQRCVPLSGRTLQLLSAMLGAAPLQALPYVNGALYSLLCEPLINQQARHMGLDKLLQFYLKQSEGELSRQLEHILGLLRGPRGPPETVETHSEDEGEADIASAAESVEEEVDTGDPVKAPSEMTGEELLRAQYRVLFPARGPASSQPLPHHTAALQSHEQTPRLSTPLPPAALTTATETETKKMKQSKNESAKFESASKSLQVPSCSGVSQDRSMTSSPKNVTADDDVKLKGESNIEESVTSSKLKGSKSSLVEEAMTSLKSKGESLVDEVLSQSKPEEGSTASLDKESVTSSKLNGSKTSLDKESVTSSKLNGSKTSLDKESVTSSKLKGSTTSLDKESVTTSKLNGSKTSLVEDTVTSLKPKEGSTTSLDTKAESESPLTKPNDESEVSLVEEAVTSSKPKESTISLVEEAVTSSEVKGETPKPEEASMTSLPRDQTSVTSLPRDQTSVTSQDMPPEVTNSITSIPADSMISLGGRILDAQLGSLTSLGGHIAEITGATSKITDSIEKVEEELDVKPEEEEKNSEAVPSTSKTDDKVTGPKPSNSTEDGTIFSPKPRLARTPPPSSASARRLQELSKTMSSIQRVFSRRTQQ